MALTLLCRQERLDAGLSLALALSLGQPVTGPERTGRKQADTRFKPGQSGNPDGRPKGARNATTLALEALLDGQANALTQKAIDLALTGDMAALRLCLDRILPPRKDRPVMFTARNQDCPGCCGCRVGRSGRGRYWRNYPSRRG